MKLPFFAVRTRREGASVQVDCPGASDCALAFTTYVSADSYLQATQHAAYELAMVSRQGLDEYLTQLEEAGFNGVRFDAKPDGSGAVAFSVAELRARFEA